MTEQQQKDEDTAVHRGGVRIDVDELSQQVRLRTAVG